MFEFWNNPNTPTLVHFCKVEAVDLISDGKAPRIVQPEEGATYDKIWKKKEVAKVVYIYELAVRAQQLSLCSLVKLILHLFCN
jgi:hypothetical protein